MSICYCVLVLMCVLILQESTGNVFFMLADICVEHNASGVHLRRTQAYVNASGVPASDTSFASTFAYNTTLQVYWL